MYDQVDQLRVLVYHQVDQVDQLRVGVSPGGPGGSIEGFGVIVDLGV